MHTALPSQSLHTFWRLLEDVDPLVRQCVALLEEAAPAILHGSTPDSIGAAIGNMYRGAVRSIEKGVTGENDFLDQGDHFGRHAVGAGMALDSMLKIIRISHYVFDRALDEHAPPDEKAQVQGMHGRVFALFERYSDRATRAYYDHGNALRSQDRSGLEELFVMLLRSQGKDPTLVARIERLLGLKESLSWVTAVGLESEVEPLRLEARRLNSMGYQSVFLEFNTLPLLITHLRQVTTNVPNDWLRTTVCGYAVARCAALIPEAASIARHIALSLPPTARGRWSIRDNWVNITVASLQDSASYLLAETLLLHDADQTILEPRSLRVLETFLRTGSVNVTAEQLHYHRNTILNRLREFKNKTGLDPQIPGEAALLLIALNILRQQGHA